MKIKSYTEPESYFIWIRLVFQKLVTLYVEYASYVRLHSKARLVTRAKTTDFVRTRFSIVGNAWQELF